MPILKKCLLCKKIIKTYPSLVKAGRGKYCSKKCTNKSFVGKRFSPDTEIKKGQKPWNAKGWRYIQSRKGGNKYVQIHLPEHPKADKSGYVREHRLIIEQQIGRHLTRDEIVHHVDGNTLNNSVDNLQLMLKKEHDRMNCFVTKPWKQKGG